MYSCWRRLACTAAWWPGWGWGAPSAWQDPSGCRASSRRGSSAPCPPANTRVTRDLGDPRDTCHVTAAVLSSTWRAGLLIWLWMHFIFYHKLISIHAALRQFVFRVDNTMDPAFRSSRNKQKEHAYKIPLSSNRKANFVPNEKKRNGICFISSAMFERWSDIQTMASYQDIHATSRHPSLHCCERRWSVCPCTQHTLSTELIMLIGSQTFPHITISFLSKLLFKVTEPHLPIHSVNIFDILRIYVYFRLMFVFSVIKFVLGFQLQWWKSW